MNSEHYNPRYYTLHYIPEHRKSFIELRLNQFLKDYDVKRPPIDSVSLIKKMQHKKLINFDYTFVPNITASFEAQARYYLEYNLYAVLINKTKAKKSYPYKKPSDRRLNFTLAHEFGHIFLDHLLISDQDKTPAIRRIEHEEANEFAGRLLMPRDILLSCNFISRDKVSDQFIVSNQALFKRLNHLKRLDLYGSPTIQVCQNCENKEISPVAYYCKICGRELLNSSKGVLTMKYDGYELDENNSFSVCPRCENEEISGSYCKICGIYVRNECINDYCSAPAEGNARYCEECGSMTTFYNNGLLKRWDIAKAIIEGRNEDAEALEEELRAQKEAAAARNSEWDIPF